MNVNNHRYFFVILLLFGNSRGEDKIVVDAVAGESAELPCDVHSDTEDDNLNILAWYKDNSASAFYSSQDLRNENDGDEISTPDGQKKRYMLIHSEEEDKDYLLIKKVYLEDAGGYYCFADFSAGPGKKTFVQLNVIEPPERLWLIYENSTTVAIANTGSNTSGDVGPYYEGDTVRLVCVSYKGKPLPSLTWYVDNNKVKDTTTTLSEKRKRSDFEYGPLRREDNQRIFSCLASNTDIIPPLSIDVVLHMHLSPELVSIRDITSSSDPDVPLVEGGKTSAGKILELQCRVLGAYPTPPIKWIQDDEPIQDVEQNITEDSAHLLVVSEIKLLMDHTYDESQISCCVPANTQKEERFMCAQALSLSVLYSPVVNITVVEGVLNSDDANNTISVQKNTKITISCNVAANPAVIQVLWYRDDDIYEFESKSDIHPTLEISNVTEGDAGEYVCSATNDVGTTFSEPVAVDVVYRPYCLVDKIAEYGVGENDYVNITCPVQGNPSPHVYRWFIINRKVNMATVEHEVFADNNIPYTIEDTDTNVLSFRRPTGTEVVTLICNGLNSVDGPAMPCLFWITDETVPQPPTECKAVKTSSGDIAVSCAEGHNGGLPQKFKFTLYKLEPEKMLTSIESLEAQCIVQEPSEENYKFVIVASNEKGESPVVEIDKDSVVDENLVNGEQISAVTNITTLALALCGGVALIALAACGLVLCAHDSGSRLDLPRALSDPPLCAYNTEESNCETYHDSDESECNVRRTDSFKRAMARYPSKNFDVRRTSSFHSARYMSEMPEPDMNKCNDMLRHSAGCRVHSLQNISRKREMDAMCDHLVMHLPPDPTYHVAKPMNTFYTMPRKTKSKSKDISDEVSEITQASDFSLPPPPDEYGTYRAATKIRDIPTKSAPTYTTVRKNSTGKEPQKQYNKPMNTVGLPTVSGPHNSVYSYPDDDHQVRTNPFDEDT